MISLNIKKTKHMFILRLKHPGRHAESYADNEEIESLAVTNV